MIASGRAHALHPALLRLACPSVVRLPRHTLSRTVCCAAAETKQRVVPQTNELLSPYQMKDLVLEHRIVYAPLTRCRAIGTLLGCGCLEILQRQFPVCAVEVLRASCSLFFS